MIIKLCPLYWTPGLKAPRKVSNIMDARTQEDIDGLAQDCSIPIANSTRDSAVVHHTIAMWLQRVKPVRKIIKHPELICYSARWLFVNLCPVNIKTIIPGIEDLHNKDTMAVRPPYLYNGYPYIGKTTSLYWGWPLNSETQVVDGSAVFITSSNFSFLLRTLIN